MTPIPNPSLDARIADGIEAQRLQIATICNRRAPAKSQPKSSLQFVDKTQKRVAILIALCTDPISGLQPEMGQNTWPIFPHFSAIFPLWGQNPFFGLFLRFRAGGPKWGSVLHAGQFVDKTQNWVDIATEVAVIRNRCDFKSLAGWVSNR